VIRLIALLLLLGTAQAVGCQVTPKATVPLDMMHGVPTLQLLVDGQPARFVLDTGAGRTTVSVAAVRRLGLSLNKWIGTTVEGIGGLQRHQDASPQSMVLAGLSLHQTGLGAPLSLAVAALPFSNQRPGSEIDGLLGRDLLGSSDLDLDLQHLRLTLFSVTDCQADFVPWKHPYGTVPTIPAYRQDLVFLAELDSRPMRTMIDSGAGISFLTASGTVRAQLPPLAPGRDAAARVAGVGPRRLIARLHRFDTLSVAGITTSSPALVVSDVHLSPLLDMLLGVDWLRTHRVWLSFATRQVFVAGR